jgi:hypothetical protein
MNTSYFAPTEKHIEDWLCSQESIEYGLFERIVGRQVRLASGICDILAIQPIYHQKTNVPRMISLCVVEIKKGDIDSRAFAQCLRYIRDLKGIYLHTRFPSNPDDKFLYSHYHDNTIINELVGIPFEVTGMLVGHSTIDPNILKAAEGAGITVYHYQYFDDHFLLHLPEVEDDNIALRHERYTDESMTLIGNAIHEVIQRRLAVQIEYEESKS